MVVAGLSDVEKEPKEAVSISCSRFSLRVSRTWMIWDFSFLLESLPLSVGLIEASGLLPSQMPIPIRTMSAAIQCRVQGRSAGWSWERGGADNADLTDRESAASASRKGSLEYPTVIRGQGTVTSFYPFVKGASVN